MGGKLNIGLMILLLSGVELTACAPNLKLDENKIELGKLQQDFSFSSTITPTGSTTWNVSLYFRDIDTRTSVSLPEGNKVTVNGVPAYYSAPNRLYHFSGSVLPETITVTWTFEGAEYSNSVDIIPAFPSSVPVDFSKSGDPSIELDLSRDAVFYSDVSAGTVVDYRAQLSVKTLNKTTGVATSSEDFSALAIGPGVLSVYHYSAVPLQFDTGAGGDFSLSYTFQYPVNIID